MNWQGASETETIEAFQRVLSIGPIDQVVVFAENLPRLIKEKTQLCTKNKTQGYSQHYRGRS